jgi:hypothetical protein
MIGSIALVVVILSFAGMAAGIVLYDRYERPAALRQLRHRRKSVPLVDERLVEHARKRGPADPRLN